MTRDLEAVRVGKLSHLTNKLYNTNMGNSQTLNKVPQKTNNKTTSIYPIHFYIINSKITLTKHKIQTPNYN